MNEISKEDKEHLKEINQAIRDSAIEKLSALMENKSYPEDYLRRSYLQACMKGDLAIVSFFMTSKTFKPNQLSVRGVEELLRYKHEPVIHWLIFDYNVRKDGAIEEVLIEMADKDYAKHIENLFEKRQMNNKLNQMLKDKDVEVKNASYKNKI